MSVHWSKAEGNTFVHCNMCEKERCADRMSYSVAGCARGIKISIEKKLMKNKAS